MNHLRLSIATAANIMIAALALSGASCALVADRVVGVEGIDARAFDELLESGEEALVLDLRDRESYRRGHVPRAVWLSVDDVAGYLAQLDSPRSREVVVVCYHGNQSREGAAVVAAAGFSNVVHLRGGMEAWRTVRREEETGDGTAIATADLEDQVVRPTILGQSFVALSAFVIKPTYMLIALAIIVVLWRRQSRDLRLLRWSMVAFLAGEGICAVNYLVAGGLSDPLELAHGAGMLVMGALLPWGLFAMVDERVIRLTDESARCAVQRLCGRCWKRDQVTCGAHRLFLFAAPLLALVALVPWSAPLRPRFLELTIYEHEAFWSRSLVQLLIEQRLYPSLAAICFIVTVVVLSGGLRWIRRSEAPFFIGVGFLSFASLRFFLGNCFPSMPAWSDVWEEVTELFTICGLALVLWIFGGQLGLGARPRRRPADAARDDR